MHCVHFVESQAQTMLNVNGNVAISVEPFHSFELDKF